MPPNSRKDIANRGNVWLVFEGHRHATGICHHELAAAFAGVVVVCLLRARHGRIAGRWLAAADDSFGPHPAANGGQLCGRPMLGIALLHFLPDANEQLAHWIKP